MPVAKRNFRKRHRHGDNVTKGLADDDDESMEEESAGGDNIDGEIDDIPTQVTAKIVAQNPSLKLPAAEATQPAAFLQDGLRASAQQQLNAQMAAQLATQDTETKQLQDQSALATLQQQLQQQQAPHINMQQVGDLMNGGAQSMLAAMVGGNVAASINGTNGSSLATGFSSLPLGLLAQTSAVATSAPSASGPPPTGEQRDKLLVARKNQWLSLMANRPYTTDSDTMSTWLMEVLSVSDLTMPLPLDNAPLSQEEDKKLPGKSVKAGQEEGDSVDDDDDDDDETEEEEESEEAAADDDDDDDDDDEEDDDEEGEKEKATANVTEKSTNGSGAKAKTETKGKSDSEKKRPSTDISADKQEEGSGEKPDKSDNVSFAEWRDRKKQKKVLPTTHIKKE